jgi:hypothetical protein
MTHYHYRGNLRTAALHVLDDHLSLGPRLAQLDAVTDDGKLLTITADDAWWFNGSLSTGELALLDWLASLATAEQVNIGSLGAYLDADYKVAVLHSLAAAFGVDIAVEEVAV